MRPTTLIDINVLVAAARSDHAQHLIAQKWMSDFLVNQPAKDMLFLTMPVVAGFVRLVTNPRVFKKPTTPLEALACIKKWLEFPSVR